MGLSPKRYVSNCTNTSTNKGVEAKEVELANARLDANIPSWSQIHAESSRVSLPDHPDGSEPSDDTMSYIQVVVQKQRARPSVPPTRAPRGSSPTPPGAGGDAPAPPGVYVLPHPLLLTYPPPAPQQYNVWATGARTRAEAATDARSSVAFKKTVRAARAARGVRTVPTHGRGVRDKHRDNYALESSVGGGGGGKTEPWTCFGRITDMSAHDDSNGLRSDSGDKGSMVEYSGACVWAGPQRIEVYYMERGCPDHLATAECGPLTGTERALARGGLCAERVLAELCAVPRALAAVPVALLVHVQRAVLVTVRGLVVGTVQTGSDYLLKPLLAVLYNAVLHPPLVLAASVATGVRDACRPLCLLLADCAEPIARVLSAPRLVHVQTRGCAL